MIFTPVSLVMKLLGKDLLDKKIDKQAVTYWKKKEKIEIIKEDYLRQF